MKIGDVLVFIGEDVNDDHFKNFTYGHKYKIKDFHHELPDADINGYHTAVFFEDTNWGCLLINIQKYFVIFVGRAKSITDRDIWNPTKTSSTYKS